MDQRQKGSLATCRIVSAPELQWDFFSFSLKEKLRNEAFTPADILGHIKQPVGGTRVMIRAADYMETTLSLLKEKLQWTVKGKFNVTGTGVQVSLASSP